MRIKTITLAALLLCLACSNGCGTWIARTGWRQEGGGLPRHYPATHYDLQLLRYQPLWVEELWKGAPSPLEAAFGSSFLIGSICIAAVDLPISLVTDTLFLPYDHWFYDGPVDDEDVDEEEDRRRKHALCPKCANDLRGSTERCPECGAAIE